MQGRLSPTDAAAETSTISCKRRRYVQSTVAILCVRTEADLYSDKEWGDAEMNDRLLHLRALKRCFDFSSKWANSWTILSSELSPTRGRSLDEPTVSIRSNGVVVHRCEWASEREEDIFGRRFGKPFQKKFTKLMDGYWQNKQHEKKTLRNEKDLFFFRLLRLRV